MSLSSDENDDDVVRITLRMPRDLHTRLVEMGKRPSLNAEIVARLEDSFPDPEIMARLRYENLLNERESVRRSLDSFQDRLRMIERQLEEIKPKTSRSKSA